MPDRGDVVWIDHNPQVGREQHRGSGGGVCHDVSALQLQDSQLEEVRAAAPKRLGQV